MDRDLSAAADYSQGSENGRRYTHEENNQTEPRADQDCGKSLQRHESQQPTLGPARLNHFLCDK